MMKLRAFNPVLASLPGALFTKFATVDFCRETLSILAENCFEYLGLDQAARDGGFRLDTVEGTHANSDITLQGLMRQGGIAISCLHKTNIIEPKDRTRSRS